MFKDQSIFSWMIILLILITYLIIIRRKLNWHYFRHSQWCLLCFKASDERSAKNLTFPQRNLHNYQTSLWHPLPQKYCPANRGKKFQKFIQLMLNNIRDQSRRTLTNKITVKKTPFTVGFVSCCKRRFSFSLWRRSYSSRICKKQPSEKSCHYYLHVQ